MKPNQQVVFVFVPVHTKGNIAAPMPIADGATFAEPQKISPPPTQKKNNNDEDDEISSNLNCCYFLQCCCGLIGAIMSS